MVGTGFFPTEKSNIYELEAGRSLPHGHLGGGARGPAHDGDPRGRTSCRCATRGSRPASAARPGAAGKDTRGMFRVHQFNKVEMFVFTTPEDAWAEHERMVALEEGILLAARAALSRRQRCRRRPRRARGQEDRHRSVVPESGALPRGDLVLEHDRLPGSSARDQVPHRSRARAPHTLNGTVVTDRAVLAILENFQGEVPDVLRAYGAPERISG